MFFHTFWLFESKEHSIHYTSAKFLSILLKNSLELKIRKKCSHSKGYCRLKIIIK